MAVTGNMAYKYPNIIVNTVHFILWKW